MAAKGTFRHVGKTALPPASRYEQSRDVAEGPPSADQQPWGPEEASEPRPQPDRAITGVESSGSHDSNMLVADSGVGSWRGHQVRMNEEERKALHKLLDRVVVRQLREEIKRVSS